MTAAALKIRYTATPDQTVDHARVRQALHAAGFDYVDLQRELVQERRPRVEGLDETVDLADAVDRYLAEKQADPALAGEIRAQHATYAQELVDAGKTRERTGGAGGYLPVSIDAENYGPFTSLHHDYRQGLTAVIADNRDGPGVDSNGSGKSFLVRAPAVALFGHTPGGVPLGELVSNDRPADGMSVTHTFRVDPATYRVRRTVTRRGARHTLDLERLVAD